ncbi:MAG: hypothetical protein FVQ81_16590 [Candidatus Glassbacteria bacterium]|nr:hypothetical protein [Candidatus Glassbacteria bacterium]
MTKQVPELQPEPDSARLDMLAAKCLEGLKEGKPFADSVDPEQLSALQRRYSRFEDFHDPQGFLADSTLVVSRITTPRPFIHLLTSGHDNERGIWGSFWDQCGSGFSCMESVLSGQITRRTDNSYVPTAPGRDEHRLFMLREETGGEPSIWHAFPQMGREESAYEGFVCEQGTSSLKIAAERNELASELTVFVPVDDPLEVWRLRLTNRGENERGISLFVAVNWGLDSYPGHYFDPRVVCKGIVLKNLNALVAVNSDKKNRHPRHGFLAGSRPFERFDMSGEEFLGAGVQADIPEAVREGACRNSLGQQPFRGIVSAMQFELTLGPGEQTVIDFLQGTTAENPAEAEQHIGELAGKYFANQGVELEQRRASDRWRELFARQLSRTPDSELDRFFNVWFKYQGRNSVRVPLSLDMVGYRDSLQYMMGITPFNPEFVAVHLPSVLRHQYADGTAMRQFAKYPGAPHDLRNYLDCCSWIPDTLAGYVQQTGDREFCFREEGFFDRETGRVDHHNKATLYEHARRSIEGLWNHRSGKGLCLIGHGDWNDSLDGVGEDGRGVSVWLTMALVFAARRFAGLARWLGEQSDAAWAEGLADEVTGIINDTSWDGRHYIYAFMGDGTPVGAGSCAEGKIHLNVNAWSLFNGVAAKAGRVEQVLAALEELDTPFGKVLISPPYTAASRQVGRIADIIPGLFENGSIYTHGQSFFCYGLACRGMGTLAWRELRKVLPSATIPDIASGPPSQVSNFTVGPAHDQYGRNFYSNFTGSVSWLRRTVERMLGLMADYDSLGVDPVVPAGWKEYGAVREFRGCRVNALVENPDGVERGVGRATLDGEELPVTDGRTGIQVEQLAGKQTAELRVIMG